MSRMTSKGCLALSGNFDSRKNGARQAVKRTKMDKIMQRVKFRSIVAPFDSGLLGREFNLDPDEDEFAV
jgi:hypothetical protein